MRRLLFRIFHPGQIKILDFVLSYRGTFSNSGTPTETLTKKFSQTEINKLVSRQYLSPKDESIGIAIGSWRPTQAVLRLTNKAKKVARTEEQKQINAKSSKNILTGVTMGAISSVIASLILAYIFGAEK
jgi:hypothetical protein